MASSDRSQSSMPDTFPNGKRQLLFVCGMHRSGTSLITVLFSGMGFSLGKTVSGPAEDNPTGFWENTKVVEVHEALLAELGSSWDDVRALPTGWENWPNTELVRSRMVTVLTSEFPRAAEPIVKDPRCCRLLPLWHPILTTFGFQPKFLVPIRNPLEVATSLARRDKFPLVKSLVLWLRHMLDCERDSRGLPRAAISYSAVLTDYRAAMQQAARRLDIPWPEDETELERAAALMNDELRNFEVMVPEAEAEARLGRWCGQIYRALLRAEATGEWDVATFDQVSTELAEIEAIVSPVVEDALRRMKEREQVLNSETESLATRLKQSEGDGAIIYERYLSLQAETKDRSVRFDAEILALQTELKNARGLLQSMQEGTERFIADQSQWSQLLRDVENGRREADERVRELTAANAAQTAEQQNAIRQAQAQIVELGRKVEEGRALLETAKREVAEAQSAIGQARAHIVELGCKVEEGRARLETAKQEVAEAQGAIGQLQAAVVVAQSQADEARSQLAEVRRQLDAERANVAAATQHIEHDAIALANVTAELAAREEAIAALNGQLAAMHQHAAALQYIVEIERYSVLKPLIRRALRVGLRVTAVLPGGSLLRHLGFAVLRKIRPNHPRVAAYGEERRRTRLAVEAARTLTQPHVAEPVAISQPSYLFFPVIDWHFRIQRPQHLAREIAAQGHRVVYFSTTFRTPVAGEKLYDVFDEPASNLLLVRLTCPEPHPEIYRTLATREQHLHLAAAIRQLREDFGFTELASVIHHPFWRRVAESLPGNLVIYDCIDYHAGFDDNTNCVLEEERNLLHSADTVLCTASRLQGILQDHGRSSILLRNGTEVNFFATPPARLAFTKSRPTVGYFGAIAEWFDIDLVVKAARAHPEWDFVLVGAVHNKDVDEAKTLPNVRFFGERPYAELPGFLHGFDVCLIPFIITELTLCTNPVKVYEYMSAGKPVVATNMPEVVLIGDLVHVGRDHQEFLACLDAAMAESGDSQLAARRAQWAAENDWKERASLMIAAVEKSYPRISVIVLCYNNLDYTKGCLASLYCYNWHPNWELVVVDNASTDGTARWLREFAEGKDNIKLMLNSENLGFAGGNNVGLEVADGDYLVMLNNDTYVSPGWMHDLVRHFRLDPTLGLVGPVTNNIGNEAKVDVQYGDFSELPAAAFAFTSAHAHQRYYVSTVAFFCVALTREVYNEVGGLDPAFRIGFFEDDDYCRRVRAAGYKIAIADDSFVHHHLSASFNALGSEEKQRIFEQNKAVYEAKWGPWQPHVYRPRD